MEGEVRCGSLCYAMGRDIGKKVLIDANKNVLSHGFKKKVN